MGKAQTSLTKGLRWKAAVVVVPIQIVLLGAFGAAGGIKGTPTILSTICLLTLMPGFWIWGLIEFFWEGAPNWLSAVVIFSAQFFVIWVPVLVVMVFWRAYKEAGRGIPPGTTAA